jgi:hypothetical protein
MRLFSRTKKPKPDTYQYTFPEQARNRILLAFKHLAKDDYAPNGSFDSLLEDLGDKLAREYGGLVQSTRAADRVSPNRVIEHFFRCSDPQVIDFILTAFRSWHYQANQRGVDEINRILREEGIGYEFTGYVTRYVEKLDDSRLGGGRTRNVIEHDYPEVIEKHEEYTHGAIVKPCLAVLAAPMFKVANAEMLKAHEHMRKGSFDDALTCCGAAYESVMKTICDAKGWTYSPKETCAKLVTNLQSHGLIPDFYHELFKSPGIIRNTLSSAHGRGPTRAHAADGPRVHHMIQVTSANILLMVNLADL